VPIFAVRIVSLLFSLYFYYSILNVGGILLLYILRS
jgi:hypothetical protein